MTPEELFEGAYAQANRMVRRVVRKGERSSSGNRWSDDIRSAAMEKLWQCAIAFDPKQGKPFNHYWPKAVLGAMVDEMRSFSFGPRNDPWPCYDLKEKDDRLSEDLAVEDVAVSHVVLEKLNSAVDELPPNFRVVMLGHRDGWTQSAIAKAEGVSEGRISQRKKSARHILTHQLRKEKP